MIDCMGHIPVSGFVEGFKLTCFEYLVIQGIRLNVSKRGWLPNKQIVMLKPHFQKVAIRPTKRIPSQVVKVVYD